MKIFIIAILLAITTACLFMPKPALTQHIGENGRWYSDQGTAVYGYGAKTNTTTQSMAAAPGAGNAVYIYWAYCVNTGATVQTGLIKGGSTTMAYIPCPVSGGYGQPIVFIPPMRLPANSAFTLEGVASATTTHFTSMSRTMRYQP